MRFKRKIAPETKTNHKFLTKKRLREDEIDFDKLRSYRLDRVKKELEKNNLEACICLLYTSPSPRDRQKSRMPSSA